MNKNILWLVCGLAATQTHAQTCQNFLFMQKDKTIEMTIYDKKGEPNGKNVYQVSNVSTSASVTTAALASELFDKKGKSMAKANSSIQCNGGAIMMDMKMMIPQQQAESIKTEAKSDAFYMEYPSTVHVGDALKDGNMKMELSNHGMQQTYSMVISNRKVVAEESVTTPAGTWSCFKITYHTHIAVKTGFMSIPFNFDGTEWYAPGFGVVKTESKYGGTAITSIK